MLKDTVKLNTGAEMPTIGLGTWRAQPGEVEEAVAHALTHGYKHIDTAANYGESRRPSVLRNHAHDYAGYAGNEAEVGRGIKASQVPRGNFFLTSKLNNNDHKRPAEALQESLQKLDTPYLDLCEYIRQFSRRSSTDAMPGLMHWPAPMTPDMKAPDTEHDWLVTWKHMELIYKMNPDRVKAIGVSSILVMASPVGPVLTNEQRRVEFLREVPPTAP